MGKKYSLNEPVKSYHQKIVLITAKWCYKHNIQALDLVVSDKKIFYAFPIKAYVKHVSHNQVRKTLLTRQAQLQVLSPLQEDF